jgi:RHS repeat-associated protein
LTKVTEKNSQGTVTQVVEYIYDVFNRRIGRKIDTSTPFDMANAVIERYVLDDIHNGVTSADGGNVVLDFVDTDGNGAQAIAMSKRYLYGEAVDQLFAQEDLSKTLGDTSRNLWPLVDHLGTVRDLAKQDGTIAVHYKYDSFGNVTSGDTSKTRYLFTSREFDTATKLQYNRARYYDAAVGRWISEDPLGFAAGDANSQCYAGDDPIARVDASGLEVIKMPKTAAQARAYIEEHRKSLIGTAAGKIDSMIKLTPPSKVPVLGDRDRNAIAVAVATVYVDAVVDQLREWPAATPSNGFDLDGFQEVWAGRDRTKAQVAEDPVCADWAGSMTQRLRDGLKKSITLPDTGEVRLDAFVRVAHGQKWMVLMPIRTGEHNFPILYPTGHRPRYCNSDEHLIVDVWVSLLPVLQDPGYYPLHAIFEGHVEGTLPMKPGSEPEYTPPGNYVHW